MKRIVLFWIPLLLLLLVNCTTESFDFGDQEGILVGGSWEVEEAVSPTRRFPRDRKIYWDLQSLLMKVIKRRMEACRKRLLPMMIL